MFFIKDFELTFITSIYEIFYKLSFIREVSYKILLYAFIIE